MYKVTLLSDAEESFKKLDRTIQKRIGQKIDWLANNADKIIHHPLTSLPDEGGLEGHIFICHQNVIC